MHERGAGRSPRASGGFERAGMSPEKTLLLFGCQHKPAPLRVVLNRGEDPAVSAEIRMTHMGALERAVQAERDPTKILHGSHVAAYCKMRGAL